MAEEMNVPARLNGISVIGICIEGNALIDIGAINHKLYGGMALILFPGESFRLYEASNDLNIRLVVFRENFIRWKGDILHTVGFSSDTGRLHLLPLSDMVRLNCIGTYETIRRRLDCGIQKLSREVIMHYLQILIYDMYSSSVEGMAQTPHKGENAVGSFFEQFLSLVSSQYREHPDVAYYADRLCISSKHFSRIVLSSSGKRASDWIANARIIESKIRLRMTKMSLADISARLKFSSPSHFGRFFKHHTGLTPNEYRNQ